MPEKKNSLWSSQILSVSGNVISNFALSSVFNYRSSQMSHIEKPDVAVQGVRASERASSLFFPFQWSHFHKVSQIYCANLVKTPFCHSTQWKQADSKNVRKSRPQQRRAFECVLRVANIYLPSHLDIFGKRVMFCVSPIPASLAVERVCIFCRPSTLLVLPD
jgi:hypothetical protein